MKKLKHLFKYLFSTTYRFKYNGWVKLPSEKITPEPVASAEIAPKEKENDWQSTNFTGYGIEWKCKTCGKHVNQLRNGIGPCCSPELQETNRLAAKMEESRRELLWALQTRVLTDEEMGRVASYDYHLLVRPMQTFFEEDIRKQFGNMLLLQFKLRKAASEKSA